jgi:hypothetical protein
MQQFVHQQTIAIFRRLLSTQTDKDEAQALEIAGGRGGEKHPFATRCVARIGIREPALTGRNQGRGRALWGWVRQYLARRRGAMNQDSGALTTKLASTTAGMARHNQQLANLQYPDPARRSRARSPAR